MRLGRALNLSISSAISLGTNSSMCPLYSSSKKCKFQSENHILHIKNGNLTQHSLCQNSWNIVALSQWDWELIRNLWKSFPNRSAFLLLSAMVASLQKCTNTSKKDKDLYWQLINACGKEWQSLFYVKMAVVRSWRSEKCSSSLFSSALTGNGKGQRGKLAVGLCSPSHVSNRRKHHCLKSTPERE